jgi:hypothetical protein
LLTKITEEDNSKDDEEDGDKRYKRMQILDSVVEEMSKGREKVQETKQKRKQALAERMKMIEERSKGKKPL